MSKKLSRQSIALTLVLMMIFTLFVSVRPKAEEASDSAVETASETDAQNEADVVSEDTDTVALENVDEEITEEASSDDGDIISSSLNLVGEGEEDEEVPDGLVIGSPWGDDGAGFDGRDVYKSIDGLSIKNDEWIILGIKSGDNISPILLNDIEKLSITDSDGNDVSGVRISEAVDGYWDDEADEYVEYTIGNGIFVIYVESSGSYAITYDSGENDEDTYTVYFDAAIPNVAAYSSKTVGEDTLLGREVEYTPDTRAFYINKYDEVSEDGSWGTTCTITGYRFDDDELAEYLAAYVTVEETDNGYKVTISDNIKIGFLIIVEYTNTGYWYVDDVRNEDEGWDDEAKIYFYYSGDDEEYEGHLDGSPQLGFSGCYMSEDLFKYGVWNDAIDDNSYYVHAATIQEVIDKLSEAAIGEAVPGYVMNDDGELVLAADVNVINTGYISVQPSQGGDLELEPQYVASSGNLNGIVFSDSVNGYYIVADANYAAVTGHSGTKGDYVELEAKDPSLFLRWERESLTNEQIAIFEDIKASGDGFVDWKGKLYRVKRNENSYTNRDGIRVDDHYFTFASTESFMDIPEEAFEDYQGQYWDYLANDIDWGVDEFRRAGFMPGLHVNLYCDMQFNGDMGELVIGYPDKVLTGGKYYNAVISDSGLEITGPDSYPTTTEVSSGSSFGWEASYCYR